jgi:hypothetical protein
MFSCFLFECFCVYKSLYMYICTDMGQAVMLAYHPAAFGFVLFCFCFPCFTFRSDMIDVNQRIPLIARSTAVWGGGMC